MGLGVLAFLFSGEVSKKSDEVAEILETHPDANIVVWLGDNNYFQRKWQDAEKWYQEAIGLDEKSFFAWRGLGLTMAKRKRWNDAAQALEKASQIKPDDLEMYIALGDIYYVELKELKKSREAVRKRIDGLLGDLARVRA